MTTKSSAGASLLAVALFFAAAPLSAQEVKIGISQPISGANGDYFKREVVNPAILAIELVNAKGGLLGHKVEYVIEDNRANAATAQEVARKLLDVDGVTAISISPTPAVLATLPVVEGRAVVTTVSEHPAITQSAWGFRSTPSGDKWGIAQARYAYNTLKARTSGTIGENNDAVRIALVAFQKEFTALGGKVLDSETFNTNDQDLRAQLTKLRAAGPELLNIEATGPQPHGLALKQAEEVNFKPKWVMGRDMFVDPMVRQIAGDLVHGVYYTELPVDPNWNAAVFKPRFGYDADGFAARSFDGVSILLAAIARANSADPEKIRDTLAHYSDFHGVLGTWGYDGSGEPAFTPEVKQLE